MSTQQVTANVKVITSRQWLLDMRDLLKGLALAGISSVVTYITDSLSSGGSFASINLQHIAAVAATAGGSYLLKNWLSPSKTIVEAKPPVEGVVLPVKTT